MLTCNYFSADNFVISFERRNEPICNLILTNVARQNKSVRIQLVSTYADLIKRFGKWNRLESQHEALIFEL